MNYAFNQDTLISNLSKYLNKRALAITRTIWVSCLSHFLPRQGGIRLRRAHFVRFVSACWRILSFSSCTQDKFVMVLAPGHPTSLRYVGQSAHLPAIKILYTLTVFWLRSTMYPMTLPLVGQGLRHDTRNAQ